MAWLFAAPKPRFAEFSMTVASGYWARIADAEPSFDPLSTTRISARIPDTSFLSLDKHSSVIARVLKLTMIAEIRGTSGKSADIARLRGRRRGRVGSVCDCRFHDFLDPIHPRCP